MLHTLLVFIHRQLVQRPIRRLPFAVSVLALPYAHIAAQTARETMDGYVSAALRTNLAIAQQTAATQRADAQLRESRGRFLPSVGLNARYSEFSGVINIGDFINPAYAALNQVIGEQRFPTNINATLPLRQETKLEFLQPLFNDALFGAHAAIRAQRQLINATRKTAMRQLAADVQSAWLGYASSKRVVATLEAMQPVLDENLRISERLVAAGQATPDVVLRARAERSEMQQQIAEAQRQTMAAARGFNLLRNSDDDGAITLADDSTLINVDARSRVALEDWALAHREELQQADDRLHIAHAQRRIANAAYLPSVVLAASYGVQGDRYQFDRTRDVTIASLALTWNFFNGFQDHARREQASFARDEATYRRREIERIVRVQVVNAFDAVASARLSLTSANDRYESAQRAFALVQRRYAEGLSAQIDFLSARAAYTAAALNQVITRYTVAARVIDLERAAALRTLPD